MERPDEVLRSGDVELRRWRSSDVEALHQAVTESIEHLRPWMPWAAGHDRRVTEEFLARSEKEWATDHAYEFAITTAGSVIGSCGLMRRIGPGGLEMGYWLHPAWTGKGRATMAAAALLDVCRRMAGIERVEIHHDAANPASGAVARRLGFTEVKRTPLPDGPAAPGEAGIQVVWRLATRA